MNGARYFAGRSGGAASDFESARLAMAVARAIEHGGAVIDEGAGRAQRFAARADVEDPKAFRSGRDFSAWIGLVPKQNSSGGKERLGANEAIAICAVYSPRVL